jgi:hypothetical protein
MRLGAEKRLYLAWISLRQRCLNPHQAKYRYYGGRGITLCKRWDSFDAFAADMGPHPGKGWTLGRQQNDKHYTKRNCRWETYQMQNRNRRITKLTMAQAVAIRVARKEHHPAIDLAHQFGVSVSTIYDIARGRRWKP